MGRRLILLLLAACADPQQPGHDSQRDLAVTVAGLDAASTDGAPADAARAAFDLAALPFGDGGQCAPRINEVQTSVAGDSRWEFVEIFNPCSAFPLDGWSLVYRSATNTAPRDGNDSATLYTFAQKTIPQNGYLVYTTPTYMGPSDGMLLGLGLADDGAIGLRDAAARLADSVAYGAVSAGHAFIETAAAPKPARVNAPGQSIARKSDGYDSNDNATDFVAASPTPGVKN